MPVQRPLFTRSKQTRIELSFLRRSAWPGCSPISTTSLAWWMGISPSLAPNRRSSARTRASSPTSAPSSPRSRRARRAPSTAAAGARSPPMASSAIIYRKLVFAALLHRAALVLAALGAGAMRQDGLAALGAGGDVGGDGLPVCPALVALLPAGSLLRNAHLTSPSCFRAG